MSDTDQLILALIVNFGGYFGLENKQKVEAVSLSDIDTH